MALFADERGGNRGGVQTGLLRSVADMMCQIANAHLTVCLDPIVDFVSRRKLAIQDHQCEVFVVPWSAARRACWRTELGDAGNLCRDIGVRTCAQRDPRRRRESVKLIADAVKRGHRNAGMNQRCRALTRARAAKACAKKQYSCPLSRTNGRRTDKWCFALSDLLVRGWGSNACAEQQDQSQRKTRHCTKDAPEMGKGSRVAWRRTCFARFCEARSLS